MLFPGYTVPPFYDSLLGKLIVWDEDREQPSPGWRARCSSSRSTGLPTTKALHLALAADEDVRAGRFDTTWLERWLEPTRHNLVLKGGGRLMRYSFGGDEHIFVEVDESMSLEAFFKALFITNAVRDKAIDGVTEICPANASFQIKFDPDRIKPRRHAGRAQEARSGGRKARPRSSRRASSSSRSTTMTPGRTRR
jgi:hypothetical protein